MDQAQYNSLFAALSAVPDYRHRRGRRYEWALLLTLIAAALLSGQKHPTAITDWIKLHTAEISACWPSQLKSIPSLSTISRTLAQLDVSALEARLSTLAHCLLPPAPKQGLQPSPLPAIAVDGKVLRGAKAHGGTNLLVSVVCHGSGLVLDQAAAAAKQMETGVVPTLLARQDLRGKLVTLDALHTTANLARQILGQQGHFLMIVKDNQPELLADIKLLFESKIWGREPAFGEYEECAQTEKGHGRIEWRQLESSNMLNGYLEWPGVGQVLRRTCERQIVKTKKRQVETHYAITDLAPSECGVAALAGYWRTHWTIENKLHYVRDDTMGEDRAQTWRGSGPQALAALRNALLNLLRWRGRTNIAAALREYAASASLALQFVMAPL